MKIVFYDTHGFEKNVFSSLSKKFGIEFEFSDIRLDDKTAVIAKGSKAVCSFVNDKIDTNCIDALRANGVQLILLRSAGYNHVDVSAAYNAGITVARVPGYSPNAVAEFAVGLLIALNRKIPKAYNRVRDHNFALDGLVGFDLCGKTIGVIGAGRIGSIFAKIMAAFECRVLVYDIAQNQELLHNKRIQYADLRTLCAESDVISLHVPLTPETFHLINENLITTMKDGVYLINTGRGGLIDTHALLNALKTEKIGGAALDVYEEEEGIFFHDLSNVILRDDTLSYLLSCPNVIVTSHQAFLTSEALHNIAKTTLENAAQYFSTGTISLENLVTQDSQ